MWGASHCESGGIRPTQRFKSCPRVGGIIKQDPRTTDQHEFQVVPPCGGHPATGLKSTWPAEFQVVPPCGGHQRKLSMAIIRILVSSRAPVWGASWWGGRCICRLARFKSCPRVGGIWPFMMPLFLRPWFQVVPPCGGHLTNSFRARRPKKCFKSCPRVGGIQISIQDEKYKPGFKSCPRVGGIFSAIYFHLESLVSSRAPVWGASY